MALRDIQSNIQKAKAARDKQLAASTTATQSGSTTTPTTTTTPKVISTPKPQPSVTQPTISQTVSNPKQSIGSTKINLFKPQETVKTTQQIKQQYGDLMAKQKDKKDVQAGPIPGSIINAANAVGGETQTQVKKTVLQQFKDWFKRTDEKMQKSSEQFREKAWEDYYVGDFWKNLIRGETQAEEYIARLTDKLAGKGNEGYVEAFEKQQGEFWRQEIDSYNKYVEAAKAGDISSQEFGKKVGEFMHKLSGGKWSGEGWAEFASSTASTLKDPRQFVGNLGNMLPWLVLSQAGGLGLGMAYGTAQQSEDVYEDFSTDEGITNNLNDNQIFLLSTGVGTMLSLVEGLGDILGDLPWAKTFSKNIRGTIGRILKKDVSKTLVKDIEDSLERDIKKEFKNPIKNAISKWFKGGLGEFAEEPIQNEIQNEVAIGAGSNRQHYTLAQLATMGIVSFVYGSALQTIGLPVNIKQNQDLKNSYEEWSKEVDRVTPGLKEEVKENMFSSLVVAQIRDAQLSDKKINKYQKQAENLYNQKAELESQLEKTTDPRAKQTINNKIKDIDTKINDIDKKINQRQNTSDEINKQLEEISKKSELPAQQSTQQQGGENLLEQTMKPVDGNGIKYNKNVLSINKKPVGKDRNNMRNTFEKSFEQVNNKGRDYTATPFANIAYSTSGKKMFGDKGQINKIKDRIRFIADKAGILLHSTGKLPLGVGGGYGKGNIVYNKKTSFELTTYGHEIFHGMMDIIRNGSMSDTKLGNELKKDMEAILNEAKEYLGIDGYEGEKGKLADKYAEEWLANAFGEYLAEREINLGPKTFKQKVINFFGRLVNAIFGRERTDKEISPEMRRVFEAIYEGEVTTDYNSSYQQEARASETKMLDEMGMSESSRWNKLRFWSFEKLWSKLGNTFISKGISKEQAMFDYAKNNRGEDIAEHLVGLSNTDIKKITKDLTTEEIKKINEGFAKVSSYLGIDFNIVAGKNKVSLLATNNDLLENPDLSGRVHQLGDVVAVMITNKFGDSRTDATIGHELSHVVDFAYKDITGKFILESEEKYDKFNSYRLKTEYGLTTEYLSQPFELWARFNQQYIAYQDYLRGDTALYEEMTSGELNDWNCRFWDNETFLKLLPELQSIYDNEIYDFKAAKGNEKFYDVMKKLNGFRSSWQIIEDDTRNMTDKEFLEDISERKPEATDELKNKILNMRDKYNELQAMVDGLKGTISNEIKKEYEVALSLMQSNLDLITSLGEEYLNMERNTKEQQKQFDKGVNTISDNLPELISEVEDNQQDGEIVDDAMKEEIEENKEPNTKQPLDIAASDAVDKVISSANKVINKNIKEKPVNEQKAAKEKMKSIRDVGQGIKDVFTPALSRLYSISPRLAGAVHVYEASVGLKTLGYKRLSENFVKELDKLKKKNPEAYKKLSLALFDWGMDDSIDIKQSLKDAGLDEKLFEPVVSVLNQIATDYQSAGLDITINDKYFPRKVKDYGLLLDYLSRKSGTNIKDTRGTILKQIDDINNDPNLSDGEKERQVHNLLINNFTKPSERSNNAKERKLVLSERLLTDEERSQGYVNDITDFYEDPIVALSNYIDDMVKKTELKKMLGGLTNDKTAISDKFDDSIAKILLDMESRGELTKEKAYEAEKVIKAIVNARATGKGAQMIKNLTYSMTIANWLSAAQQLEDLSKTLLRGPSGLKNIVKSVVGKANIGMKDTGIDNIFAELEGGKNITDLLFKLSGFDAVDALGKKSFLNTARDSCVKQANSDKRSIILKTRLIEMYGEEMGNSIFESYKSGELRDKNGNLKLDVMIDLMYQLGNTQPIYKSAMPTAYLNNPKIRVVYCLWSFTLKQVDRVIQGTKEVYNNQRLLGKSKAIARTVATLRCTGALTVVSIISALVQELINWAKGDEDDLMFKKWREEGFGAFLKQFGINSLSGLLKIFNISKYDQYIFDREGLDAVFINKITPAWLNIPGDIIQVLVGKDKVSEIGKYMPLFLKLLYYQFKNRDMLPDYKLWGGGTSAKPKFGKNGGGGTAVKFGKY